MAIEAIKQDRTRDIAKLGGAGAANDDIAKSIAREMSVVNTQAIQAQAGAVAAGSVAADNVQRVGSKYNVQRGDNLSHIARDQGVSLRQLTDANPQISNPNLIHPGQQINLPTGTSGVQTAGAKGAAAPNPGSINGLSRGAQGPEVAQLQERLAGLGYSTGKVDGSFGPVTQSAVRRFQTSNDLPGSGVIDDKTAAALNSPDAKGPRALDTGSAPNLQVYTPGSPEQIALFREAAQQAGLPESWASSPGLINILRRESGGKVGIPNYTYGARAQDPSQWGGIHDELKAGRKTAKSSATGLGQLLLANVDRYYPSGRAGIGNPVEEAAGMMKYIQDRYGNPDNAWALYGTRHEGY